MCLTSFCPNAPQSPCSSALKSLLLIKNKSDDTKDKLTWKWIKGAATTVDDLKDPTTTANYALCIYAGSTNALVAQLDVPPSNTKWQPLGSKGFKFLDNTEADDGAQKIKLKSGSANKSKALVKGRGTNLPDPLDAINGGPLQPPVTTQLINLQTGACFGSTFNTPLKNTTSFFKAKAP